MELTAKTKIHFMIKSGLKQNLNEKILIVLDRARRIMSNDISFVSE